MEEWKSIAGYEGLYEVSNYGRVKSLGRIVIRKNGWACTFKQKILRTHKTLKGYVLVDLHKNNKAKRLYVHRLVAEAFIPNHKKMPEINHKDEDKENNAVGNLEWCSRIENVRYGTGIKRGGQARSKKVYQYSFSGELIKIWDSNRACRAAGFDGKGILLCVKGVTKQHQGYRWSYEPETLGTKTEDRNSIQAGPDEDSPHNNKPSR